MANSLKVLSFFREHSDESFSMRDIRDACSLSSGGTYSCLLSLVADGFIVADGSSYPKLFSLKK